VYNVGREVLLVLIVLLLGNRLVWFGDFFRRCWKATAGHGHRVRLTRTKATQTTNQLQQGVAEQHQRLLELEARRLDTMLVGGSIGLAAWSQLFVSSNPSSPASRLSGLTLGLLFAGAACLIAGPLLWRGEGLHLTLMGRSAALHVGFGLIALSLSSAVLDLHLPVAAAVGIAVVLLIGVRDMAEVGVWVRRIHPMLRF
jgi:hypothetical protein